MRPHLIALALLAGAASADPIEGVFEVTKVNDKPAADLLRAPETVWARYLQIFGGGKVAARLQVVHKTKDADRFIACEASVTANVTWKGSSYTIPDDIAAEGAFTNLARTKEGDKPKVSTERKSCTVFLKKGTYKADKTKDGAKLTTGDGDVFWLAPADIEPKWVDLLAK